VGHRLAEHGSGGGRSGGAGVLPVLDADAPAEQWIGRVGQIASGVHVACAERKAASTRPVVQG
jgi:hypothetical protein